MNNYGIENSLFAEKLPSQEIEQVVFDYRILSTDKREFVLQKTDETQWLLKKTAENIVKIGRNLQAVKEMLPHGMYLPWLQSEFGMSETSADRFRQVSLRFGGENKSPKLGDFSISALYLLAAPSTPQSAIDEAFKLAEDGKKVTHAMAQRLVEAEKAKEKAEQEKAQAIADAQIAQQHLFDVRSQTQATIAELNQHIETLQKEKETLSTPIIQIQEKEVFPEAKVKELENLQAKIDELNNQVKREAQTIPPETQKSLDALQKQVERLKEERERQEATLAAQRERIAKQNEDIQAAIRKREFAENQDRIRQNWRQSTSEAHSCLMRVLGQWPTPVDAQSFDADDWARVDHLKNTLKRVVEECNALQHQVVIDDEQAQSPYGLVIDAR